ncbi:MAG: flavodoxin domain-containing protein [Chloroflexota bacterium]
MNPKRVLVAFSSRSGSTAGAAEEIAAVLRSAGFTVDCRPKEEVGDVSLYRAVVLGSGMYVASRASDGGGFLERHRARLRGRDVWLFSTGPIGARAGRGGPEHETAVITVAKAICARGVATFGTVGMPTGADPVASLMPAGRREIRSWAADIAADLGAASQPRDPGRHRCHGALATG